MKNNGTLFKNTKKEADTHADYQGQISIDGKEYWLNAWINKSKDGKKTYMSLSAKPKTGKSQPQDERHSEVPF